MKSRYVKFMMIIALVGSMQTPVMQGVSYWPVGRLKECIKGELTGYGNRFLQSDTFKHIKYAAGGAVAGGSVAASKGFIKTILGGGSLFDGLFDMVSHSLVGGFLGWFVGSTKTRLQKINTLQQRTQKNNTRSTEKLKKNNELLNSVKQTLLENERLNGDLGGSLSKLTQTLANGAKKVEVCALTNRMELARMELAKVATLALQYETLWQIQRKLQTAVCVCDKSYDGI